MRILLSLLLIFLGTTIIAQEKKVENPIQVNADEIISKFSEIKVITYSLEGNPYERFYGINDHELFEAFGKDRFGTYGSDTLFSKDDLLFICFSAIQELGKTNSQLVKNQKEIKEQLSIISDNNQNTQELLNVLDELKMKMRILEEKMHEMDRRLNENQINDQD